MIFFSGVFPVSMAALQVHVFDMLHYLYVCVEQIFLLFVSISTAQFSVPLPRKMPFGLMVRTVTYIFKWLPGHFANKI